jgi:putative molybdopterin biosynthesis protein
VQKDTIMSEASPLTSAQQRFTDAVPFRSLGAETCPLAGALGRTLYSDVTAPTDLPPYHRVIVEGFIVRSEETAAASEQAPVSFTVTGTLKPGDERCPPISKGQAVEVATGVVAPDGPYSVVRMWEARREGDRFTISRPFPPRFFIEEQGCDLKKGAVVAAAGTVIGAAELGNIAALGITQLQVSRRPRVTVMACGDEVIPYDRPLRPGLIRDSNSVMLSAAVSEAGGEPRTAGILRDDFDAFVAAARKALTDSDMLLISGGTAAGGGDFISNVVRAVGELLVDGVPMRSGRPLIMGTAQGKPLVCVAGHPPEALRGFRLFGAAALNRLMGREAPLPEE